MHIRIRAISRLFAKGNRREFNLASSWLRLITLCLLASSCKSNPSNSLSNGEITVSRVAENDVRVAPASMVQTGDWQVQTPIGTLFVSCGDTPRQRGRTAGEVLGILRDNRFSDNLSSMVITARQGESEIQWQPTAMLPQKNPKGIGLSITKVSSDHRWLLRSFISYAKTTRSFKIWSRIQNIGTTAQDNMQISSALFWDGGFVFAPRMGFIEQEMEGVTEWIAMKGKTLTTAVVLKNRPYLSRFGFDPHGPYENVAQIDTRTFKPNEAFEFEQHILLAEGGLEAIAPNAWKLSGLPTARIVGTVTPMQSWGEIEFSTSDKKAMLQVEASQNGYFEAILPFGDYTVTLITPGGRQGKSVALNASSPKKEMAFSTIAPGILHYLITDEALLSIPARLIVRGIPPTPNPILGPRNKASGAENVIYSIGGAGSMELPAGKYEIVVTHGPEYAIAEQDVEVQPARHVSMQASLREEIKRDGWLSADFHLHAEPSYDSDISLEDRVISLYAENVDIAVATDHNVVSDYSEAQQRILPASHQPLYTVSGVEVTTKSPIWGHFNVFPWSTAEAPPPFSGQTPSQIFAFARAMHPEALIQVNHPRMDYHNIGYFTLAGLRIAENRFEHPDGSFDFDAIEVFNGMDLKHPDIVEQNIAEWFGLLNMGHRFTATGNSDSHFLAGHFAGYPRNYLHLEGNTATVTTETIVDAVRLGKSFVSNGPFIAAQINDATFGDETAVRKNSPTILSLEVQSATWLPVEQAEVFVNGVRQALVQLELPTEDGVQAAEIPLRFTEPAWVVVKVSGNASMGNVLPGAKTTPLAFSNPIWIKIR